MTRRRLRMVRAQRMPIVNAMLAFVVLIVILQLWLLTATMNAYLGGDESVIWPAAGASLACLLLNVGLLRYLYQMEKTLADNREKVGAVASDVESAIAEAKKALAEGGVERLNEAFNQLQTASHKLAEALYQQAPPPGAEASGDQASAAGASSSASGSTGDDNVIDAEYVDVEENK